MKIIYVVLFLFSSFTWAQDINFTIPHKQSFYDNILKPLWVNLNYQIPLVIDQDQNQRIDIQVELLEGSLNLGKKPNPLFQFIPLDNDQAKFKWKLSQLKSDLLLKVRFIFTKLGATVTHDEKFKIEIRGIKEGAESTIKFSYLVPTLKLQILKNQSLEIQELNIKPKDGIGSMLKWIFDNVFSEREVNNFIKDQLNFAINKSLTNSKINKQIEMALNQEIFKFSQNALNFSQLASQIYVTPQMFKINKTDLKITSLTDVQPINKSSHPCTLAINNKAQGTFSYNLLENLIKNILIYERIENNTNHPPLLCVGYNQVDESGLAQGLPLSTKILGRATQFKLWVKPLSIPRFFYRPAENIISAQLKLAAVIKGEKIPTLNSGTEPIEIDLNLSLSPEFTEGKGLKIHLKKFELNSIKGNIILKYARILPKFKISLKWIRSILEKTVAHNIERQLKDIYFLKNSLPFYHSTIEIMDVKMNDHGFDIRFDLK
jgi:hypothetical protein